MSLPSIQAARGWSGLTVVDSDDQPLGKIIDIYLDRDTELPEWALVAMPGRRRRTFVPLAGAARKGNQVAVAVSKAAMGDAPTIRPGRELSDDDAARLYGHYVGSSGDGNRGARRARGRGRRPEAGRSRRLRWLLLAGLGPALGIVAVLARRVRRRRTPTVGEALGRALAELLAAFQAALARGRGRR